MMHSLKNIEAYVIADYLMTAATRLQITDPATYDATRRALAAYGNSPEARAALAFLDTLQLLTEDEGAA
jgi:hypothetical protein